MAITRFGNNRYFGLTSDTKPTNVPSGARFTDDEGTDWTYNGSSWVVSDGYTKTETFSGKTLDAVINTIKNTGSFTYKIFKSGSTYYCINNLTGAIVASNSSPNTVLQYPLTNGGSVFVYNADYELTGTPTVFLDFPAEPAICYFIMDVEAWIVVPAGSTGKVFRFTNAVDQHCNKNILSCNIKEAATNSNNWIGVLQEGNGSTNTVGVSRNLIYNSKFEKPYSAIKLNCATGSTKGYLTTNFYENIFIFGPKNAGVDFQMDETYALTPDINGLHRGRFRNFVVQGTGISTAAVGFKNIRHKDNIFYGCYVADFGGTSLRSSIHADATGTIIDGGSMTDDNIGGSAKFVDSSTAEDTMIRDGYRQTQIPTLTPGKSGTNLDIVPLGTTNTTSWWNNAKTERCYVSKQATEYLIDFVKQESGGSLRQARFRIVDVPGGTSLEAIKIDTSGIVTLAQGLTMGDAKNIVLNTTTGTKIGTATTQKLGFYNATPIVQGASIADATDNTTAITRINLVISRLEALGLIATV